MLASILAFLAPVATPAPMINGLSSCFELNIGSSSVGAGVGSGGELDLAIATDTTGVLCGLPQERLTDEPNPCCAACVSPNAFGRGVLGTMGTAGCNGVVSEFGKVGTVGTGWSTTLDNAGQIFSSSEAERTGSTQSDGALQFAHSG